MILTLNQQEKYSTDDDYGISQAQFLAALQALCNRRHVQFAGEQEGGSYYLSLDSPFSAEVVSVYQRLVNALCSQRHGVFAAIKLEQPLSQQQLLELQGLMIYRKHHDGTSVMTPLMGVRQAYKTLNVRFDNRLVDGLRE